MRARSLAAICAGVLLTVSSVSAAQATKEVVRDAVADVVIVAKDGSTSPDPTATGPDLTRVIIKHSKKAVTIKARTVDATPDNSASTRATIKTSGGETFVAWVGLQAKTDKQYQWLLNSEGHKVSCQKLKAKLDYNRNLARLDVPRECLRSPDWVRVGVGTGWTVEDQVWADDVRRDGLVRARNWLGKRLKVG